MITKKTEEKKRFKKKQGFLQHNTRKKMSSFRLKPSILELIKKISNDYSKDYLQITLNGVVEVAIMHLYKSQLQEEDFMNFYAKHKEK